MKKTQKQDYFAESQTQNLRTLQVSRLGFGCCGLTGYLSDGLSQEDGCQIIKQAFMRGITFFDTSDLYGADHGNEVMLGKVVCFFNNDMNLI